MIIIDMSQLLMARLAAENRLCGGLDITDDLIRRLALSTLVHNIQHFKNEYGDNIVVACDNRRGYWRKNFFPYYKAMRKKVKAAMNIDFTKVNASFEVFKQELKEHFPYNTIESVYAEADDVIGTLCHYESRNNLNNPKKILIISGDHDFIQLQQYSEVYQWNPVQKIYVSHINPKEFLQEHIIKGDTGDGIPNVFSDADTLIMPDKRQSVCTKKRLENLKNTDINTWDKIIRERHKVNQKIIDLDKTPTLIKEDIINQYIAGPEIKSKILLHDYFLEKNIPEYIPKLQFI